MTGLLLLCLGAAVGAPARYLVDRAVQARHDSEMPWGTMLVNIAGSFLLGALVGAAGRDVVPAEVFLALGPGLCGALTTYSTFGYESLRLFEDGDRAAALLNVLVSVVAGLGAAVLGFALTAAV